MSVVDVDAVQFVSGIGFVSALTTFRIVFLT